MRNGSEEFVKLEKHICIVCGCEYNTGGLLMHKNMKSISDDQAITGWGMCEEHTELRDKGFVAMVGVSNPEEVTPERLKPENANRTGEIAHIRMSAFKNLFNAEVPEKMFCFCSEQIFQALKELQEEILSREIH